MKKLKLSFDLDEKNRALLEKIKCEQRIPYGNTINSLIDLFCTVPNDVSDELLEFLKKRILELSDQVDTSGEYERCSLINKLYVYTNLAKFFNNGQPIKISDLPRKPKMRKVKMLDGILLCPDSYILLNPDVASCSSYATVIECNNTKYGAPHFVFFSQYAASLFDESDYSTIHMYCIQEWPRFREILNSLVIPIEDPDDESHYLNAKAYLSAPRISYWPVTVHDDPALPRGFQPPNGTEIFKF